DSHLISAPEKNAARAVAERFRVVLSGTDTGCDVERGDDVSSQKARLIFGQGCSENLPDLEGARFWNENEDGTIAFTGEDGKVRIRFAAGDGLAYESYGAGAPLIALISRQ